MLLDENWWVFFLWKMFSKTIIHPSTFCWAIFEIKSSVLHLWVMILIRILVFLSCSYPLSIVINLLLFHLVTIILILPFSLYFLPSLVTSFYCLLPILCISLLLLHLCIFNFFLHFCCIFHGYIMIKIPWFSSSFYLQIIMWGYDFPLGNFLCNPWVPSPFTYFYIYLLTYSFCYLFYRYYRCTIDLALRTASFLYLFSLLQTMVLKYSAWCYL